MFQREQPTGGGPQKRNRDDEDQFKTNTNNNNNYTSKNVNNSRGEDRNYNGGGNRIVHAHQKRVPQRRDEDDNDDGADDELRMQNMDPVEKEVSQAVTSALALDLKNFKNSESEAKQQQQQQQELGDLSTTTKIVPSLIGPLQENRTICAICGIEKAKYTCPACNVRTCSLACVKLHKSQSGCTGERNPAEKIGLASFTDHDLVRDLRFIEEGKRIQSNCKRSYQKDFHEIHGDSAFRFNFRTLPPPLHNLREGAKRHGIICQILSEGLSKRAKNTSRYDKRTDTVTWRAEFRFHRSVDSRVSLREDQPSENSVQSSSSVVDIAFTAATDWASERFKLIDIIRSCAEANPKLDSHHIRKGYSKLHEWLEGPKATPQIRHLPGASTHQSKENPTALEKETDSGLFSGMMTQAQTVSSSSAVVVGDDEEEEEEGDFKDENETDEVPAGSDGPTTGGVGERVNDTPQQVPAGIEKIDVLEVKGGGVHFPQETSIESSSSLAKNIEEFLKKFPSEPVGLRSQQNNDDDTDITVFIRTERMGAEVCYFQYNANQCKELTLHDVMRDVFFVVEYPIFEVVRNSDKRALAKFPVISQDQRIRFRDTFKSKNQQQSDSVNDDGGSGGAKSFGELLGGGATGRGGGGRGHRGGRGGGSSFTFSRGRGSGLSTERVNMEPGSQKIPCRNFAHGSCVHGELCPYQHIALADLPPCRSMVLTGKCDRGDRCSFNHDPEVVSARARELAFRGRGRGGNSSRGGRGGVEPGRHFYQQPPTGGSSSSTSSQGGGAEYNQMGYPLPPNPFSPQF